MPTYFLTGATGYIGGSVADGLLKNGVQIRGLVRNQGNAARLQERGVIPVLGDLEDAELLAREASASDGVINTASADHRGAVEALISGLAGSGKPLLHTSGSSVVGDDARGASRTEAIYDEDTPFVINPMKQARHEIDQLVLRAAGSGVRSAVICPSLIYGLGRGLNERSVQLPFLAENALAHGVVQIVGTGKNTWSNVHIDDVVGLYVQAIAKAPPGAFYFAENGEASFAEIGEALAKRLNLPGVEALSAEVAARQWGEPKAFFTFGGNSRVRARRARSELGWVPRHASVIDWILNDMPV
jgi:nucleoside-diphosphate-sugar epimerase